MDDSELEEGEACEYTLDPDAYSYIDEKLQNCLGHLQREFVGGELSAENMGPRFGGYGSFLPIYRRSPSVLSQPRSPPKLPNNRNSVSPYNHPPLEGTHHNRSVVTSASISTRNIPKKVASIDNPAKKEILTSGPSSRAPPSSQKHNSLKGSVGGGGGMDQKALKVRIKVGNESTLRKNNAAIYGDLGLNISPSSSLEGSSGGSAGRSAESRGIPGESPQSILETMTCSLIPGGFLLSPIRGCFVNFTGKTIPLLKNAPHAPQFLAESNPPTKEPKAHKSKKPVSDEKIYAHTGTKVSKELPALPSKEQTSAIDLVKERLELIEGDQSYASKSVENGDVNSKVKPRLKSIKGDKKLVECNNKERFKESSSLDIQRKNKGESKKQISISRADSVESNRNGDQSAGPSNNAMKNLLELENPAEVVKVQPQLEERRVVQKEKQSSNSTSTDRKKESVMKSKKLETLPKNEVEREFTYELSEEDLSEKKKKPVGVKIQNEKNFAPLREAPPKERLSNNTRPEKEPVSEAQVNNPVLALGNLTSAEPVVAPIPPMEIKENWVACDKCHKWRLLPYWTNPESLPKKWHCKLLDWLPGKNRCDVGEEETTAGANALNLVQLPLPGTTANASNAPVPGVVQSNSVVHSQIPKKKKEHREGTDLMTNSLKKREKASLKGNFETASYGSGGLGIESRSADFTADKHKFKHQNSGRYSDGGDNIGKASKHSKSKNKRPVEPDDSKVSKKIKKEEDSHPFAKGKRPESDLPGNAALDIANTSSKKTSLKSSFNERLETKGTKIERRENYSAPELERHDRVPERIDAPQVKKIREQKQGDKVPNSNRRDVAAYAHPSVEATSSSSKVSGSRSRRSKTKLHERRGSPVESVSSSPIRHLSSEKLQRKGMPMMKEEVVNTTSYILPMVSPKRGPSTEIERPSKQPRLSEIQRSTAEDVKTGGVSRNVPLEQDSRYLEKKSAQPADRSNHHEKIDGSNQRKMEKSEPKVSSRPKEKHRSHIDKAVTEKPQPGGLGSKLELETSGTQMGASTVNNDSNRIQGNGDLPKPPQPKKPETTNGLLPNSVRQATPNPLDTSSPARRDGHSAAYALLKEARALKHSADRLKNDGSELDSTGLYFEAALKFLQAASLCEPAGGDTSRQGDATQAMQIYSETAKLCDFCAHAYERCKKMGAAALAYKCVEVAYLKAAFYKNPGARQDRHELQTTLQMVQLGESPSSSASDIDNLNNHGLAKVASVKDSNSPQVVGANHLMAARNHPYMMRLLAYTNDLNCAFDATRKSQTAFAAVNANSENGEVGNANVIASVRSALDFGFHNVRELLQLVRVSMESVCS